MLSRYWLKNLSNTIDLIYGIAIVVGALDICSNKGNLVFSFCPVKDNLVNKFTLPLERLTEHAKPERRGIVSHNCVIGFIPFWLENIFRASESSGLGTIAEPELRTNLHIWSIRFCKFLANWSRHVRQASFAESYPPFSGTGNQVWRSEFSDSFLDGIS